MGKITFSVARVDGVDLVRTVTLSREEVDLLLGLLESDAEGMRKSYPAPGFRTALVDGVISKLGKIF